MLAEVLVVNVLLLKMHSFHADHDAHLVSSLLSWIIYLRLVSTSAFNLSLILLVFTLLIPWFHQPPFSWTSHDPFKGGTSIGDHFFIINFSLFFNKNNNIKINYPAKKNIGMQAGAQKKRKSDCFEKWKGRRGTFTCLSLIIMASAQYKIIRNERKVPW